MDSKQMLDRRIGLATNNDNLIGMVLEGSLIHLAMAYGASTVDPIRKQVMGGDKTIRSFFWYPVNTLLKIVRRLADEPGLSVSCEQILMGCGENAFNSLLNFPVGKMLIKFGKGNPQALLSNGPYAYTLAVSFGERDYKKTSETSAEVSFTRDLLGPAFTVAVYKMALKVVSNMDAAVVTTTVSNESGTNFIIHSRW
jgi:uncharacterized protein (TIGR02265 family)